MDFKEAEKGTEMKLFEFAAVSSENKSVTLREQLLGGMQITYRVLRNKKKSLSNISKERSMTQYVKKPLKSAALISIIQHT